VGQDGILQPVVNRPVADEQTRTKSADAIGAQDAILPHGCSYISNRFSFSIKVVRFSRRICAALFLFPWVSCSVRRIRSFS